MKSKLVLFICCICTIPALILGSCAANRSISPADIKTNSTPADQPSSQPTSEAPVSAPVTRLSIWIPDQLLQPDPEALTSLLEKQAAKFSVQNPTIQVELRVKKSTGKGSLLESLQGASLAAPGALPDLVLLSSADMETSALKGLLVAYDGSTDLMNSTDWAEATRELAKVQGSTFGIPVVCDATVLATKTGGPTDSSIYKIDHPISVYLNDPRALFLMGLYLSGGGELRHDPARPELDKDALTKALTLVDSGFRVHAFNPDTLNINGNEQAARRFTGKQEDQYIGWYSALQTSSPDWQLTPVPGVDGRSASMARGWFWSMPNPDPLRRQMTIQLVEVLSEPEFLAEFARLVVLIPARDSVIVSKNQLQADLFKVLASANPEPDGLILVTTGAAFRDAILQSQRGDLSPAQIADGIIQTLIR